MTVRERNGRFQAIIVLKKHGQVIHQESQTFSTEALAKDWRKRTIAKIKAGGIEARVAAITTFANLVQMYRGELVKAGPVRRSRLGALDQLENSSLGPRPLGRLDGPAFVQFAEERKAEGAGPTTILLNLATVRAILGAAKPMFGLDVSPQPVADTIAALRRVGAVAPSRWRDRRLKPGEEQALIAEFERVAEHPSTVIPMAKIVRLALCWPRRREEILDKLQWEWLVPSRKVAILKDTKNPTFTRDEMVPVPREAWDIINSMPKVDERVFPFEPQSVSKAFERACARLGIEDLRFHDLRHEGVSRLFEAGLEIPEVCAISGHMSWNTLQRYTHLRAEKILEKLDGDETDRRNQRDERAASGAESR